MKSIAVPEDLHKEILNLKLEEKNKNVAELLRHLVLEHKRNKFLEASEIFRKSMTRKKLTLNKLLKRSRKIREEVVNEQFPDICSRH